MQRKREKTVKQKLVDRIMAMLNSKRVYLHPERRHLIVHDRRLRILQPSNLKTGDIYVMHIRNAHGNTQSRQTVSIFLSILEGHIALTPLLKGR